MHEFGERRIDDEASCIDRHVAASALGRTAHFSVAIESDARREIDTTSDGPLHGMRAWLLGEEKRALNLANVSRNFLEQYSAANLLLNEIHDSYASVDSSNTLSRHTLARLLINYARFREATGSFEPAELTRSLLEELYYTYLQDVRGFMDGGVRPKKAESLPIYHSASYLDKLREKYEPYGFVTNTYIGQAFATHPRDPDSSLEQFVANVNKVKNHLEPNLRNEYDFPGEWSMEFVARLCNRSSALELKAKKIFELANMLQQKYPRATKDSVMLWAQALSGLAPQVRARINADELLEDIPIVDSDEEVSKNAALELANIRDMVKNHAGTGVPTIHHAAIHRLVRTADLNWQAEFDEVDLHGVAARLYYEVMAYRKRVKKQGDRPLIQTDTRHLYALLSTITSDIVALKQEGIASRTDRVAFYHAPGTYKEYLAKYKGSSVPPNIIKQALLRTDPDSYLEAYMKRVDEVEAVLGHRRVSVSLFARSRDGTEKARQFLAFLPEVEGRYKWVSPSDVAYFFANSSTPESAFADWVDKVETIQGQKGADDRDSPFFPVHVIKLLARNKTADTFKITDDHAAKCKKIYEPYRHNIYVTPEFVASLSIRYKNPQQAVATHLDRVEHVKELLAAADEDAADFVVVRNLASSGVPKSRVEKYLQVKNILKEESQRGDEWYDDVESWMITQVAGSSLNLEYARHKLRILRHLKRQGKLVDSLDRAVDQGHSLHERSTEKNPEIDTHALVLAEELTQELNESDRMAVLAVFGFDKEYSEAVIDRSLLEETLGVPDLEAYVMNEVIPYMRRLSLGYREGTTPA